MSLGWKADFDTIELNSGDWIYKVRNPAGPFPAGTIAEVLWANGTTWPATVTNDMLSWHVEAPEVASIPNDAEFRIMVRYPNLNDVTGSMYDYEWRIGRSRRINQ